MRRPHHPLRRRGRLRRHRWRRGRALIVGFHSQRGQNCSC
jgi:hypothetical protein